jgi:hypothetical protein
MSYATTGHRNGLQAWPCCRQGCILLLLQCNVGRPVHINTADGTAMRVRRASLHDNSAIARVAAHRGRPQCVVMPTVMLLPGCYTPQWEGKERLTQADRNMARSVLTTRDASIRSRGYELQEKHSVYSSGQAVRVPAGSGSQISTQSVHDGGKTVSPTHWPSLPKEIFLLLVSARG